MNKHNVIVGSENAVKKGHYEVGQYRLSIREDSIRIDNLTLKKKIAEIPPYHEMEYLKGITIDIYKDKLKAYYRKYNYSTDVIDFTVRLNDNDINFIDNKIKKAIKENKEEYINDVVNLIISLIKKEAINYF